MSVRAEDAVYLATLKDLEPNPVWLGLDIGGTKIAAVVMDHELNELSRELAPTRTANSDELMGSIETAVQTALQSAQINPTQIAAIGAGVPGLVNPQTGEVRMAVNLNLHAYPLGAALTQRYHAPAILENDVRMAALGAFQYVRQQESITNLAYLSIGTGVSAGLILDGQLHRGSHGMAGEIGHIIADPAGELCACGLHGCLETIIAGPAIARQWQAVRADIDERDAGVTAVSVFNAAQQGDKSAQSVIDHVSYTTARAIQWLVMAYDVDKIVLGGGVGSTGTRFLNPVLKALANLRAGSPLAQTMLAANKIMLLPSDYNAATWGAILLARNKYKIDLPMEL